MCVCVCVCKRERERERECVCVRERARECTRARGHASSLVGTYYVCLSAASLIGVFGFLEPMSLRIPFHLVVSPACVIHAQFHGDYFSMSICTHTLGVRRWRDARRHIMKALVLLRFLLCFVGGGVSWVGGGVGGGGKERG